MTYREALEWMFSRLPIYQQQGRVAYSAKLEAILEFSAYLGNPHRRFKSIHVAGTNGKGSSSHMLASVLQEAGYRVGLYTSPHLKDFRERIRLGGEMVSRQYVLGFLKRHKAYLQAHPLSFFEMTVGMAFEYFHRKQADIAVIEVGLGGRLDSTNIIIPEVSLITNIGFDHMEILGDTLPKIALEKAGIIKPGVPVVVSETQAETEEVFRTVAMEQGAPLYFADQMDLPTYPVSMLGAYQQRNLKGVLATLNALKGFPHTESHIRLGLSKVVENTGLLGRWQTLGENPRVICDTAHNREGLEIALAQVLGQSYNRLHIVIGVVREKPLERILPVFPREATYYFARPNIPRGLEAETLREAALPYGLTGHAYPSVATALKAAIASAGPNDLVFVGGSTFTVAEVV